MNYDPNLFDTIVLEYFFNLIICSIVIALGCGVVLKIKNKREISYGDDEGQ